jgi:hypothetical protein
MSRELILIKQLVLRRKIIWTGQSESQMAIDGLTREEVIESIVNARSLRSKRSTSPQRGHSREKVHIIVGRTYAGLAIYTKGVIRKVEDRETFYVMISAKRNESIL